MVKHYAHSLLSFKLKATSVNSLWPNEAMWRRRSGSTLAQVMVSCLMS